MPLGSTIGPYWAVIRPLERTNLIENPSGERGTTGWGTVGAGTVGTTADAQRFGAWAGSIAPTSMGTAGGMFGTWLARSGTTYTVSAYVNGQNGVPYVIAACGSTGVFKGSALFTGGGTWQRYSFSYAESAFQTPGTVIIRKASGVDTGAIYVDGVQVEIGANLTTYIDGDQEGCRWMGQAHNSRSYRSGTSYQGGSVVALSDLGFTVDESPGIGIPPIENASQSYAILDGAQYQRTRYAERPFTLSSYLVGTSWQDLHRIRRDVIRELQIDRTTPQQPLRLWYIGAGGTAAIDAVLDDGLSFGEPDGFTEIVQVRFMAYDPAWKSIFQQGIAIDAFQALGSVNSLLRRDQNGQWGTVAGFGGTVYAMAAVNQTIFFGGDWTTASGTTTPAILTLDTTTGTVRPPTGGTIRASTGNRSVRTLITDPAGTLYVGGVFDGVNGTNSPSLMYYAGGAWGSFTGGTIGRNSAADGVTALLYSGGSVFAGGGFSSAGGSTARFFAFLSNGSFGTIAQTAGTVNDEIWALGRDLEGVIYLGGVFGSAGGTGARKVAFLRNGAFGTMPTGIQNDTTNTVGGTVRAITTAPNNVTYLVGQFGTAGGYSVSNVAAWNGVSLGPVGSGVGSAATTNQAYSVLARDDGALYVGGRYGVSGARRLPDGQALYNGYAYLPLDVDVQGANGFFGAFLEGPDGALYVGGGFFGTARAAAIGTAINAGQAPAYPTLQVRNVGATGTARVYELVNNTTGDGIYFDLTLQPGEEVSLDLTPGARSFTSSQYGTIWSAVIGGSNLATWRLMPGTNYVSFFADTANAQAALFWTPRAMSADLGTV